MTPERWQRISALYTAALPLQAEERAAFVDGATAGEPDLRRELLELLEAKPPEADFLEHPPVRLDLNGEGQETPNAPQFKAGEVVCDGRFRVDHLVGRGGMGRVYQAYDTSLGRTVALKIVSAPRALAESSGLRLRNEAALVSKLNHHGICTLHDLCRHEGVDIAVMEFVEGETLSARLDRTGMSQDTAIKTAMEILDALEYAHRNHVIHRDVKPSNVILTRQGAKLLDFGIAKVWPRNGATETDDKLGLAAAGTPAYMAPERVSRQQVDARADLYSLGVMLCEMLTRGPGARPIFPDVEKIAPPLLKRVIARCLADDPDARWQTAGDLRAALDLALFSSASEPIAEPTRSHRRWLVAAAVSAIALMAGAWTFWPRPAAVETAAVQFPIGPPPGSEFPPVERAGPAVISPDGTLLAMAARDGNGTSRLWLRRLDVATPTALAGTDGASHPFWSPDSKEIGFFANGKLRSVSTNGGAPRILCDAEQGRGGAWSKSGVIVFAPGLNTALSRVAASGGVSTPVTLLNRAGEENSHRWPAFLPDGDQLLFVVRSSSEKGSGLFVTSLDGKKHEKVGDIASSAEFIADADSTTRGHLLFVRGNQIVAQPFDARRLALEQEPRTVAELAWTDATTSRAPVSASATGVLVYGGGYPEAYQLAWQRNGKDADPAIDPGGPVRFVRLGPDPRKAAIERLDFRTGGGSIWLLDTMRGTPTRLTFGSVAAFAPVWSYDGKSIIYTATPSGAFEITSVPVEGSQSGATKVLAHFPMDERAVATDVAKDGTLVLDLEENGNWNIAAIDPARPNERNRVAEKPSNERQGRISPDERWITYTCDESGSNQVYVAPFRGSGSRIQVSVDGGTQPSWGRASNEIFFIAPDRSLMKSVVDYTGQLFRTTRVGGPIPRLSIPGLMSGWEYAVSATDQAIFAGHSIERGPTESVAVLLGWRTHLGR